MKKKTTENETTIQHLKLYLVKIGVLCNRIEIRPQLPQKRRNRNKTKSVI